jgi:integrase
MTLPAARAAAEAALRGVSRAAVAAMADDGTLTQRVAKAQARRALKTTKRRKGPTSWTDYLSKHYEPWAIAHRKTGDETVARLKTAFGAALDGLTLDEITPFAIERWRTERRKGGVAAATVNRDLAALRGALTKAVEWGFLPAHPMSMVKASKVDTIGHVRYLTADEAARLLAALAARDARRREDRETANGWRRARGYAERPSYDRYTDHLTPLVLAALHTGCRRGELFALRWADVDLPGARLTVRAEGAKSGLSRVVPLNTTAVDVFTAWKPADATADGLVFPGADGDPMTTIKTAFLKVLKNAKITGFRFHDLRHTFASRLVMAGVDLNTVRELLGHADLKMTLRYAHLQPEHKAAAVEKLVAV